MLRFSNANISFSFQDYVDVLAMNYTSESISKKHFNFFKSVFDFMTSFKSDYFTLGDLRIFLTQLLFGLRFAEVESMYYHNDKEFFTVHVKSLKGTRDRNIVYDNSSPLLKAYISLLTKNIPAVSYKAYYRALYRSNPNFYCRFAVNHLHATHLPRHFFIQTLFYILNMSKSAVQKSLSWYNNETIESYIDLKLWDCLNLGGAHGTDNNKPIERKQPARSTSSSRASHLDDNRKAKKKKVKRKKSKE